VRICFIQLVSPFISINSNLESLIDKKYNKKKIVVRENFIDFIP
jgi:hypothetical protein